MAKEDFLCRCFSTNLTSPVAIVKAKEPRGNRDNRRDCVWYFTRLQNRQCRITKIAVDGPDERKQTSAMVPQSTSSTKPHGGKHEVPPFCICLNNSCVCCFPFTTMPWKIVLCFLCDPATVTESYYTQSHKNSTFFWKYTL